MFLYIAEYNGMAGAFFDDGVERIPIGGFGQRLLHDGFVSVHLEIVRLLFGAKGAADTVFGIDGDWNCGLSCLWEIFCFDEQPHEVGHDKDANDGENPPQEHELRAEEFGFVGQHGDLYDRPSAEDNGDV